MFLWRTIENRPLIIIKSPPYLTRLKLKMLARSIVGSVELIIFYPVLTE